MSQDETLLKFPCRFPIKVMGAALPEFREQIVAITRRHAPDLDDDSVAVRASAQGRYLSVTVTVNARSREQLDDLYRELTSCELVAMVL